MSKRAKYQPPPGYRDAEGSATRVGVHVRTWWRWHSLKKTPPVTRIGCRLIWREVAIDEWLLRQEEPA